MTVEELSEQEKADLKIIANSVYEAILAGAKKIEAHKKAAAKVVKKLK